jgi:hypothetical protein
LDFVPFLPLVGTECFAGTLSQVVTESRLNRIGRWMRSEESQSRLAWRLFWVGFAVRVAFLTVAHTYRIKPLMGHFGFGWEMGRIGRALATGYGFADPFDGHSGPTAWTPPIYPLLLGGVFKVFGVYTDASAWVILTLNSAFSAATAPAVVGIARLSFARGTGTRAKAANIALWSGWLWALYPAAMQYAVHWIWDMALTTCVFAWTLVVALRLRAVYEDEQAAGHASRLWLGFGLLWGLVSLSNTSLLSFLPFCGFWIVWPTLSAKPRRLGRIAAAARGATLAAVCCLGLMATWTVRNALVFHTFLPMRSNFGAELYESVLPANEGFPWGGIFPAVGYDPKFVLYRQMGEIAFSKDQAARAKRIIAAHPGRTLGYIGKRAWFYWAGVPHPIGPSWNSKFSEGVRELDYCFVGVAAVLGLILAFRRRIPAAWLFFWMLAIIPLLFYAITVQARFRAPLEPAMLVLIVYLFQSAEPTRRGSQSPS